MINAAEQLKFAKPLGTDINPFGSGAGARRACTPVHTALGEVIRHIERRCPMVVVAGRAGTGKTLLVDLIVRACSDMGLSARQIDRGDLTDTAPGTPSDVQLVDEADSLPAPGLHRLTSTGGNSAATTCVFLCRPSSVYRFNCPAANVVELQGLSIPDARTYLLEQANSIGRSDLFTPDAMDLIIQRACGSCRSLQSIASLAFSTAAWEGERQIGVSHIAEVVESQMISVPVEDGAAAQLKVSHNDGAARSETKHLPERNSDFHEFISRGGDVSRGRESEEHPLKQLAVRRTGRLAGIAVGIAAFIGLAGAASGLLLSANNSRAGINFSSLAGAPAVREPLDAAIDPAQTLAVAPAGTTNQTGPASDAAEPTAAVAQSLVVAPASPANETGPSTDAAEPTAAANSPPPTARQPTAASRNLNAGIEGRASTALKSGSPAPVRAARPAPTRRAGPPARAATQRIAARQALARQADERAREAAERARQAEEAARQAGEAARQAADAQREADNAARRADDAVRHATEAVRHAQDAARQAEAVTRQADFGMRIILRPPPQTR